MDTNATINANAATSGSAGATLLDPAVAGSTAAAVTDSHADKTAKPDSSASDAAQLAIAPLDPSASQSVLVPPQPVAIAIAALLGPAPAATIGSGSGSDSGAGQDAAQIAALGEAVKAGALSGKPAGAGAAAGGAAAGGAKNGAATDAGASPPPDLGGGANPADGKIADGIKSTPALTPPPGQSTPPSGPGQRAAAGQPADGTAASQPGTNISSDDGPNVDPSIDPNVAPNLTPNVTQNAVPKRDAAASAKATEDITRLALDTAVRHGEATAADAGSGGANSQGDGVQPAGTPQSPDGGLIAPTALTTAAAPTAAPPTSTPTTVPIAGLAVEIAAHAYAGKNRFEIRLDPPELGRIDVRLDVDRDGKVTSRLLVERPQTLDMLRRDAPELERSLQQAGLKTSDNALQFSLRDQGGFGSQNPYSNSGSPAGMARVVIPDRDMPPVDAATAGYGRAIGSSTGLDIRV